MLELLFFLLIFIIFFIILTISLPYHYDLYFSFDEVFKYRLSISVLFLQLFLKNNSENQSLFIKVFNLKKEINISNDNKAVNFIEKKSKKLIRKKIKNKTEINNDKKVVSKKKRSKFNFIFKLINQENLNQLFKFILDMIKILKIDYLKMKVVFSLADPYYNGLFLAYYYTFKQIFDYPDLSLEINWQEVVFKAKASAGGKIIPLQIFAHILRFIFSFKSLKIFWQLYQLNFKKG